MRRLAIGLLVPLCGCIGDGAREFAVTVVDASEIECVGSSNSAALEQETMDQIAKDLEKSWEEEREGDPPSPEGRLLRVNESHLDMRAWFDPHPGAADNAADPDRFDNPIVVYLGEVHEGYIEGTYEDLFNTDEQDEEIGREPCGDRRRVHGVLSVTDAKGLAGRIRWHDHTYVESVTSACAGLITCVRDIEIDGLETE